MTLLWHDGFGTYATANSNFVISYPTLSPSPVFNPHAAGRFPGTFALQFNQGGTNWFQTPDLQTYGAPGTDVCILGFAAKFTTHPTNGTALISLFSTANFEQTRVIYRQLGGSEYYFEVARINGGVVESVLATSPIFSIGKWRYHEVRVVYAQSGGVIELRTNGARDVVVQNVRTEGTVGLNRGWSKVRFRNDGSTGTFVTDIYVMNEDAASTKPEHARFLGDVASVAFFPDSSRGNGRLSQWVINPRGLVGSDKVRIVVQAGQSNANGNGTAPLPVNPGIQTPNPSIAVWWNGSWQPLQAGVNNNNRYQLPVGNFEGPEMAFADLLADYFAQMSNVPQPTGVALIKGAQGSSSIYPNLPDFTWDVNTPGNLWNDLNGIAGARGCLFVDIVAAVAALGGWSKVEKIDFYWHQGETDAIFDFSAGSYGTRLNAFFDRIKSDLPLAAITFHLVQLHANLVLASGPNQLNGFWFRDTIRGWHQTLSVTRSDTKLIHIDDIPLAVDQTHFTKNGYDTIGQRYFDSWLAAQSWAGEIDDLATGPQDDDVTWLGTKEYPRDVLVQLSPGKVSRGTRVRNVRFQVTGKSDSTAVGAKILADNGQAQGESAPAAFPAGSYSRKATSLDKNPATALPFSEEQLEDHQFGLRSSA